MRIKGVVVVADPAEAMGNAVGNFEQSNLTSMMNQLITSLAWTTTQTAKKLEEDEPTQEEKKLDHGELNPSKVGVRKLQVD